MAKDLRSFIDLLKEKAPEEFVQIDREISSKWEISCLMRNLQRQSKNPVLLFQKVRGHEMPVIANLYASRKLHALALGTTIDKIGATIVRGEENPIPPRIVDTGPVKEIIRTGNEVDLTKLPIVWHCEKDAGPYITAGVGIVRDPETGICNAGMYRHQLKGPSRLGIPLAPDSHGTAIRRKYEARGQDMEIAVVIGNHPLLAVAAVYLGPLDVDELAVFGGHLSEPADLVKCETVDLEVPADAEIVIEGRVPRGYVETEGPMGEMLYYSRPGQNPVIEVTAITHRHDAIFQDLCICGAEHGWIGKLGFESQLFRHVKSVIPQILAVRQASLGPSKLIYLKVKQDYDGLAKQAGLTALAASPRINGVIVFDEDIDIDDPDDVAFAIGSRVRGDSSIMTVPEMPASRLDPLAHRLGDKTQRGIIKSKFLIDATKPVDIEFPERAGPPQSMCQEIRPENYVPRNKF